MSQSAEAYHLTQEDQDRMMARVYAFITMNLQEPGKQSPDKTRAAEASANTTNSQDLEHPKQ
jgi:hypothetical protein